MFPTAFIPIRLYGYVQTNYPISKETETMWQCESLTFNFSAALLYPEYHASGEKTGRKGTGG